MLTELYKRFSGSIDLIRYQKKLQKYLRKGYIIEKVEKDNPLSSYKVPAGWYSSGWYTVTLKLQNKEINNGK